MTGAWQPRLGAIASPDGVAFRVWAPEPESLELQLEGPGGERTLPMQPEGEYWTAFVPGIGHGQRYRFRLDGGDAFPDPCSRFQPEGVHGPSEVVDPARYTREHDRFARPHIADLVIYEAHMGTLTPGGTFDAAIEQLPRLRELGINALEIMPVAAFPGRWNWGYDGVAPFAPVSVYGGPDGLRRLVDAAHAHGIAVILDVVYNHFGPDGNYTGLYSSRYTTSRHHTPWGDAINYDDSGSEYVREFVTENLLHWFHEYHVDGFRLDATHAIFDDSPEHILAEIRRVTAAYPRDGMAPWIIAETGENNVRYFQPLDEGGYGHDAVWTDDFHHAIRTLMRREDDGYFMSYAGTAEELARTIQQGFLYEGQHDPYAKRPRGTPAREQPWYQFTYCIQNHDQVGNRAFGDRLTMSIARDDYLAASLLLLLLPQMPLLFQCQEFHASAPFLYFTDHHDELGRLVTEGRRQEFADFRTFNDPALRERIPDPQAPLTFEMSRPDLREAETGLGALCQDFYRELIALRHADPVLGAARRERVPLTASATGHAVLVDIPAAGSHLCIAANFGDQVELQLPAPGFAIVLHSQEPRWGGNARAPVVDGDRLTVPPHTAAFLRPRANATTS